MIRPHLTTIKTSSIDYKVMDAEGLREEGFLPYGRLLLFRYTPLGIEIYYKTQAGHYEQLDGLFAPHVLPIIMDYRGVA